MENWVLSLVLGVVVLLAAGLFLRATLGGGKMLGRFADRDDQLRRQRLEEAAAARRAQSGMSQPPSDAPAAARSKEVRR